MEFVQEMWQSFSKEVMGLGRSKIRRKVRQTGKSGDYFASCYGKRRFGDKGEAEPYLYSFLKAYKCRHCIFWHIGRYEPSRD